jgi:hypothetical protein
MTLAERCITTVIGEGGQKDIVNVNFSAWLGVVVVCWVVMYLTLKHTELALYFITYV